MDTSESSPLSFGSSEELPWKMDDDELKKHAIAITIAATIPGAIAYYLVDLVFPSGVATNAFYLIAGFILLAYLLGVITTWLEEEFGIDVEQKMEDWGQKLERRGEDD